MPEFDPYVEWLEIDPALCPPNHYDLLGITPFENDPGIIEKAFESRLQHVRSMQTGPRGIYTQDLLNELTQARLCLLNLQDRLAYDDFLRGGRDKPPVSVDNLAGGGAPPIDANAIEVSESNSHEPKASAGEKRAASKRLSLAYAACCLVALFGIWGVVKLTQSNSDDIAAKVQEPKEDPEMKPPPKKIINVVEETKGLLPGANNSFSLSPQNAKIDESHPVVIDTTDGQLVDQWQPAKSKIRWEIWINSPGHYEAIVSYNATTNGKYSRVFVKADEEFPMSVKMRTAEESDHFFEEEFVILFRKRGAHVIYLSVEGETGDFRFKSITLRPNRTVRE